MADILLDPLQVKNTDGDSINPSTQDTLAEIASAVAAIASVRGSAADLRATILSGVITTCSTITTVTNLGGNPAINVVANLSNMTYILGNENNIS